MGAVIPLKKEIDNSYSELKNLVGNKLRNVDEKIKYKLGDESFELSYTECRGDFKIDLLIGFF